MELRSGAEPPLPSERSTFRRQRDEGFKSWLRTQRLRGGGNARRVRGFAAADRHGGLDAESRDKEDL
jgi:hypothetical protein